MKGIGYIVDEHDQKISIIIDLETIHNHEEEVHDLIDAIIAEGRSGDEKMDWETVKQQLKDVNKL